MAADNYSDVVQALAQQIVATCTKLLANNVQSMIRSANIDASQITGDTSLIVGGGGGTATSIDASDVIGLNTAIANAIAGSSIDVSQIVRFDENVGLVVAHAQINTAQIRELQAYVADIADARIDNATIDTAKIRNLETEVARIANAAIDTATIDVANVDWANIDWANIKNSITGHAIITQGVGGQLYITDLAVTEANMVSLTVGELARLGQLFLQKGRWQGEQLISEGAVEKALVERSSNGKYGYGYFIRIEDGRFSFVGKWGQRCTVYPDRDLVVAYMSHQPERKDELAQIIHDAVTGG